MSIKDKILESVKRYINNKPDPPKSYSGRGYDHYLQRLMVARERFEKELDEILAEHALT